MKMTAFAVVSALALTLAACGKKDTPITTTTAPSSPATAPAPAAGVAVSSLNVGNAIGSDKKIEGTGSIAPQDTIYVSVDTTGSGEATLKSRWTHLKDGNSTMVKEDTQRVTTSGPATHEFHVSKPDGWPKGDYQVELFVNDASAGSRRFSVS